MFITEEEMNRRLSSSKNLSAVVSPSSKSPALPVPPVASSHDLKKPVVDNSTGAVAERLDKFLENPPKELKTIAASLIAQGVAPSVVSKELSISQTDIRKANPQQVNKSIEKIREMAIDRLLIALGVMNQDMFEGASLKDVSASAAHLSKIIANTSEHEAGGTKVQFILHTPEQKILSKFQVIDV